MGQATALLYREYIRFKRGWGTFLCLLFSVGLSMLLLGFLARQLEKGKQADAIKGFFTYTELDLAPKFIYPINQFTRYNEDVLNYTVLGSYPPFRPYKLCFRFPDNQSKENFEKKTAHIRFERESAILFGNYIPDVFYIVGTTNKIESLKNYRLSDECESVIAPQPSSEHGYQSLIVANNRKFRFEYLDLYDYSGFSKLSVMKDPLALKYRPYNLSLHFEQFYDAQKFELRDQMINLRIPTETLVNSFNKLTNLFLLSHAHLNVSEKVLRKPPVRAVFIPVIDREFRREVERSSLDASMWVLLAPFLSVIMTTLFQPAIFDKGRVLRQLDSQGLSHFVYYLVAAAVNTGYYTLYCLAFVALGKLSGISLTILMHTHLGLLLSLMVLWGVYQAALNVVIVELCPGQRSASFFVLFCNTIASFFFGVLLFQNLEDHSVFPSWLYVCPQGLMPRVVYFLTQRLTRDSVDYRNSSDAELNKYFAVFLGNIAAMLLVSAVLLLWKHRRLTSFKQIDGTSEQSEEGFTANEVRFGYSSKSGNVLDGFSLRAKLGQIVGILGLNGAGKSTFYSLVIGLLKPKSGSISINGVPILEARGNLAYCSQFDWSWDYMTIREHFSFQYLFKGRPMNEMARKVEALICDLELEADCDRPVAHLSGGMRRRLTLGCAVILDTELLLLDEPSTGLDVCNCRSLWKLIKRISFGRIILLSTHQMEEVEEICDEVCIIHEGKSKGQITPKVLMMELTNYMRVQLVLTKVEDREELMRGLAIELGKELAWKEFAEVLTVQVHRDWLSEYRMVELAEQVKQAGLVRVYSIMKMSFEDVFLNILENRA
jgi:ABC-type multidrug transport system ATPase subunit